MKECVKLQRSFSSIDELCITHNILVSNKALEVLGRSCPLLKSLTYCGISWQSGITCDDEAFAIAKTMPTLRYFDINGNPLSDVGLIVIRHGCPLLESLNIQKCLNLDFSGKDVMIKSRIYYVLLTNGNTFLILIRIMKMKIQTI